MKNIHVEKNEWLIRITFDCPDQKINKLSSEVMEELCVLIKEISTAPQKIISFESAKKDIFIAGADIEELQQIDSPEMAKEKACLKVLSHYRKRQWLLSMVHVLVAVVSWH